MNSRRKPKREIPHLKTANITKIKKHTHDIKLIFEETAMEEKALERGLLTCNMSITPEHRQREYFLSLLACFSCCLMEEHITKDCLNRYTIKLIIMQKLVIYGPNAQVSIKPI